VCVCARARARVCARACVCVCTERQRQNPQVFLRRQIFAKYAASIYKSANTCAVCIFQGCCTKYQDRQCEYNAILWGVRLTIVVMQKEQCVPFTLLLSCKTFSTAVNDIKVLRCSCKEPDIVVRF
jgi:hypothetical protein